MNLLLSFINLRTLETYIIINFRVCEISRDTQTDPDTHINLKKRREKTVFANIMDTRSLYGR